MRSSFILLFLHLWGNVEVCLSQNAIKCRLTAMEGTRYEPADRNEFSPGETLTVYCARTSWISSPQETSIVTTCEENGQWSISPTCKEVTCIGRKPENVNYWGVSSWRATKLDETISYSCQEGYKTSAVNKRAKCTRNGWTPNPPCEVMTCRKENIPDAVIVGTDKEIYRNREKVIYACGEGGRGRITLTCGADGWTGSKECEAIKCRLTAMEGTRYEPADRNEFSPGETLTVYCARTSWISSPQETSIVTTCEENGQWSISPTCKEVTCIGRKPENVNYWGVSSWRATKLDETISYSCQEGYKTSAVNKRAKCTRNGWTPNPPCEVMTCRKENIPDAVIVGTDKEIYRNREKVIYACGEGGRGRITLTCGADGWTGSKECEAIKCRLTAMEGTRYEPADRNEFSPGETLTVYCARTSWISSPQETSIVTTCEENGQWSISPTCKEVTCIGRKPENVNYWGVSSWRATKLDETISYSCQEGYKTSAVNKRAKCTRNGWTPNPPCEVITCRKENIPDAVIVGTDKEIYRNREKVIYACGEGGRGRITLTCGADGWTGSKECEVFCDKLEDITITFTANKEKYMDGENIHFKCVVDGAEGTATCNNTKWVKSLKCTVQPCEGSAEIPNGRFQVIEGEELVFGTKIKYFCNKGYKMTSKETTRICTLDGWSNHVPTCEPVSCDPPTADGRLIVKGLPNNDNPILPRYSIDFSCSDPGSNLIGSEHLVCGEDGQWDDQFPSCEEITCEVGVMPPHVDAVGLPPGNNTVKAGHKLQFQCDNRRPVYGPAEIECLKTGEWSAGYPTCDDACTVKDVSNTVRMTPRFLTNNQLIKGQKLRFECTNPRDTLRGNAEVACLANGQWSHDFPTCGAPLACGAPPLLVDGDIKTSLKNEYSHGERVEYGCQNLYTMEGGPHKTCNNGEWTGSMTCLKPCTANEHIMASNNIRLRYLQQGKLYSSHNDFIEFICTRGRPVGRVGMRQRCVNGQMNFPTCE
ncbi:complement factor H-like isoform X1 [Centropristis striata]|uniref:complement factor H-like isoform X1 n=1 Tax=Centropristis striata TaxID=184440 RepID=UPI0027DF169B|nr:complement factor H-like isoform X1 [Centropristis striata]